MKYDKLKATLYDALYQEYIEQADKYGIPEDERMSMFHIRWEFYVHVIGEMLNIKNAHTADLNYDETILSMGKRYLEDKLCVK